MKLTIKESYNIFDYYGLYIEPKDDEAFIVYNQEEAVINRIAQVLKNEWLDLQYDTTDYIKEILNEQYLFNEYIDGNEINYDDFVNNDSVYLLNRKQIKIIKNFM